jgi:hypothetical protein
MVPDEVQALLEYVTEMPHTRTSQNSVWAKFAERPFHEFRRCRSELHICRGRKRNIRIFEISRGCDTPLIMPLKDPQFPYRSRATVLQSGLEGL